MSAFRKIGLALLAGATVVAEAHAQNNARNHALSAEMMEENKWEKRRLMALEGIEAGLRNEDQIFMYNKENQAIRMRAEAADFCRRRSDVLMSYLETEIVRFQQRRF